MVPVVQISMVWTALGWMAAEASFCPANLGARAIASVSSVNAISIDFDEVLNSTSRGAQ